MKLSTSKATVRCFFSVVTMVALFCQVKAVAQGNLLITPKRVVFEGSKRSQELNLANNGKDTATYVVSFIQYRMKEDGTFERITQPDSAQNFADKYLRFFPRTVTLAPNEAQTVKVQITKSNELTGGEYRSHLYFRAVPKEAPLGEVEPVKDSSISVKLVPIFGLSIPVIIRQGESTAKVSLSDIKFQMEKDTIPSIKITFNREGNMSVYGDLSVEYVSPEGKVTRVAAMNGMAVYTPNARRNVHLPLAKIPGVDYNKGKLRVVYADQSAHAITLAENEIVLTSSNNSSAIASVR